MTALAMIRAYQDGRYEDLAVLGVDEDAMTGMLALAGVFLDEIEAMGGDPEALLRRIYARATAVV